MWAGWEKGGNINCRGMAMRGGKALLGCQACPEERKKEMHPEACHACPEERKRCTLRRVMLAHPGRPSSACVWGVWKMCGQSVNVALPWHIIHISA